MNFSKSKYCGFYQCPKITWLKKNKPELFVSDEGALARMDLGNELGDLAMGLFGDYKEMTVLNNGRLDIPQMIENTKKHIENGTEVICEAAFDFNGLYCAVDILKKEEDGYSIYEVKSSTREAKHIYIVDVSYQKYVLEKCGLKIVSVNIVSVNNEYVFDGNLELNKLFKITNVDKFVEEEIVNVENNLIKAEQILNQETEPDIDIHKNCNSPYPCGFWKYCSKNVPTPSIFDIYCLGFDKKVEYYNKGIVSMQDFANTGEYLGPKQNMQITHAINDLPDHVDKPKIEKFLNSLTYPLYFLDFETVQMPIPAYVGLRPFEPLPIQYSLHYILKPGGKLKHKEFLAPVGKDPRRAIAKSLCKNISKNGCVLAYNKGFESGRLNMLAAFNPDLKQHLQMLSVNMKDLIVPFQEGYVYNKLMGGSFSIKSVLPALYPNDPSLDYHNLQGVHNGNEAMAIYLKLNNLKFLDRVKAKRNLLTYCKLDTYAMVKIYDYLVNAIKE